LLLRESLVRTRLVVEADELSDEASEVVKQLPAQTLHRALALRKDPNLAAFRPELRRLSEHVVQGDAESVSGCSRSTRF
jgi:hypothetical protein